MKVLLINSVCGIKSTGRICTDLADKFISEGHEVKIAYGRETVPVEYKHLAYKIGTDFSVKVNALKARIFDNEGFNAYGETKRFIEWAENYNPDLVWLHNLHGYYINLELLFNWIKSRPNMEVKWTFHDCWTFTGHCAHFSYVKCYKWKEECNHCIRKSDYPKSFILDNSNKNFNKKKQLFTNVNNLTIITPSNWLADLVKNSFFKNYRIEVVYNTIDTKIFKPTPSDFRKKYNLEDKKVILGVASAWSDRKGLTDFIKLSQILDDGYKIVLVGLNKKQQKRISDSIVKIEHTNSVRELAEIYSAADVFVNPSKEETFGLTTLEAISCGTSTIVYKDTACEEIANLFGGIAVEQDVKSIIHEIKKFI